MSNGLKQFSIFGVAGVLIAIVIIAGFVAVNDFIRPVNGTLTIEIMDKPVELKNLYMTIDWAKIKDEDGNWYDLEMMNPDEEGTFYFDLLALQYVSETLSVTEIPEANYTAIWIHVLNAKAIYPDESTADLNVPSDIIKVLLKPHLSLEGGGQVTVLIDLQPDDLNAIAASHNLNLRPVIKAMVPEQPTEPEPTLEPSPSP
ncbi:DUF4382 domain-containing protein [Candidatus Bathyarchaeota archaeon]|nr:DUF4382 domain-containing protein [Candidatus Bathyarchaeota archaeon]